MEAVGLPLSVYILKRAAKGPLQKLRKSKIKRLKKKFIKSVDSQFLSKFGNEVFYDRLSKCLICDSNLDLVFSRCYDRDVNDILLDSEFLDKILSNADWNAYEFTEVKNIMKYLLEKTFAMLNVVNSDSERKMVNIFLKGKDQIVDEIRNVGKSMFQEMDNRSRNFPISTLSPELIPKSIFSIIDEKDFNVVLRSNSESSNFKIDIWVEMQDDMSKFESDNGYIEYLNFRV